MVNNLPAMQETQVWSLGQEDPIKKGMATHFSIFAWKIPWTEVLVGYNPLGQSQTWLNNLHFHFSQGFPGGSVVKESTCQCRRHGFDPWIRKIPTSGTSPGEGNGNPLQYSCLGNFMERVAWQATVHRVPKSRTRLSNWPIINQQGVYIIIPWVF